MELKKKFEAARGNGHVLFTGNEESGYHACISGDQNDYLKVIEPGDRTPDLNLRSYGPIDIKGDDMEELIEKAEKRIAQDLSGAFKWC